MGSGSHARHRLFVCSGQKRPGTWEGGNKHFISGSTATQYLFINVVGHGLLLIFVIFGGIGGGVIVRLNVSYGRDHLAVTNTAEPETAVGRLGRISGRGLF